jgi:hypothetical protein
MRRMSILTCSILFMSCLSFAQPTEEDVVLLKNGQVFRGTIKDKITAGGTITIASDAGQSAALYWAEIVLIKRLPLGIPDSVLVRSFDHEKVIDKSGRSTEEVQPPSRGPVFDFKGFSKEEDAIFLVDGSILRGIVLNQKDDGTISFWSDDGWKQIGEPAVKKFMRVEKGIPDSTLIMTHVKIPGEWRVGENRILSVHAGMTFPMGDLATAPAPGVSAMKSGFAFGIDAGIPVVPGFRWLTSVTYSRHARDLSANLTDLVPADGSATPCHLIRVLTGIEARTYGPSLLQLHAMAQCGLFFLNADGYEVALPRSYYHLSGTAKIQALSSTSFGVAVSGGLLIGRLSLDLHWMMFRPEYTNKIDILYEYGYTQAYDNTVAKGINVLTCTLGFSVY